MASNEASQAHLIGFKPWGPKPVQPNHKLILRVATRAGKKEKLCWRKKKQIACLFIRMFLNGCSILIAHYQKDSVPNASSYL